LFHVRSRGGVDKQLRVITNILLINRLNKQSVHTAATTQQHRHSHFREDTHKCAEQPNKAVTKTRNNFL